MPAAFEVALPPRPGGMVIRQTKTSKTAPVANKLPLLRPVKSPTSDSILAVLGLQCAKFYRPALEELPVEMHV